MTVSPSGFYWNNGDCFLDIFARKSSQVHLTPPKCRDYTLFFVHEKLFAFGGGTCVQSVKVNGGDTEWKPEAPMLHLLRRPYVANYLDKLYVFGERWSGEGSSQVTMEYDPVWNEWKMCSEMPGVCVGGAVVALNHRIYLVGGLPPVCFAYTPAADAWTVLSPPQNAYGVCSATAWNGKILLVGPQKGEEYDPERDCWNPNDSLVPGDRFLHYNTNLCLSTFFF